MTFRFPDLKTLLFEQEPQTLAEARERLRSSDGGARARAAKSLANSFPRDARGSLGVLLEDDDWRVRSITVRALARAEGQGSRDVLVRMTRDENATVARSAWRMLSEYGTRDDLEQLERLRSDTPKSVQGTADSCIRKLRRTRHKR